MVKAAVPVFVSVIVIGALVVASGWLPKPRLEVGRATGRKIPYTLSATVCGLPTALSATDSVPVRALEVVGVKVTLIVQLAPAAKVAGLVGQALAPVLVAVKSPEAAKELIVKAAVPVLVSVTVTGALMVASGWLPKPRLVGANPTAGAVPLPRRGSRRVLAPASAKTAIVAAGAANGAGDARPVRHPGTPSRRPGH